MPLSIKCHSQVEELEGALLRFKDAHWLLFNTLDNINADLDDGSPSTHRVRVKLREVEDMVGEELKRFVQNYRERRPSIMLAGLETFIVGRTQKAS